MKDKKSRLAYDPERAQLKPLGRYLIELFTHFEAELFSALHESAEFRSITLVDHNVLRCLGSQGRCVNEIAEMTGVTKQAVSRAVSSLEERGFVQRKSDPVDGRAQVVGFTAKGVRLFNSGMAIVAGIERRYERILGRREFESVKRSLGLLIENYEEKVGSK